MTHHNLAVEGTYFMEDSLDNYYWTLKIVSADYDTGRLEFRLYSGGLEGLSRLLEGWYHREDSPPKSSTFSLPTNLYDLRLSADDYSYTRLYGQATHMETKKVTSVSLKKNILPK